MQAAFFDLDKTVIAKASMLAFGRTFFREGMISRRTVVRSLYAQAVYKYLGASEKRIGRLRESVLALTEGWEQSNVIKVVTDAVSEIAEPLIYREAVELIRTHKSEGRKVYLVSASPIEIVNAVGSHLGVDGSIASRPAVINGCYTGEMDFYAYGPYKVEAMLELAAKESLDLAESYAYSDSYTDIPMLEAVGHPVAVNPDRVLHKRAKERGWEVMEFKERIRLHNDHTVPVVLGSAGAAGLAGLGFAFSWYLRRSHQRKTDA